MLRFFGVRFLERVVVEVSGEVFGGVFDRSVFVGFLGRVVAEVFGEVLGGGVWRGCW